MILISPALRNSARRLLRQRHRPLPLNASSSVRSQSLSSSSITDTKCNPTIRIGHVERPIHKTLPLAHLTPKPAATLLDNIHHDSHLLQHLQWMMQKDSLAQDMLLVGPPGSSAALRRNLALLYARLHHREVQIVNVTSDLTESDLKQRRELVLAETPYATNMTTDAATDDMRQQQLLKLDFVNAAPVDAAIHGRILILDGLERASRNVLPTLNNLLEHRSMNLEDGRFLISRERYDQLLASHQQISESLVPVHEDFRVIATCVPAPTWPGRPLDPPLRSRFQIRRIETTIDTVYSFLKSARVDGAAGSADDEIDKQTQDLLVKLTMAMEAASQESVTTATSKNKIWPLPLHQLSSIQQTMTLFPRMDLQNVLLRAYPVGVHDTRMPWYNAQEANRKAFDAAYAQTFGSITNIGEGVDENVTYELQSIKRIGDDEAVVTMSCAQQASDDASWFASSTIKPTKTNIDMTAHCGRLELQQTPANYCLTESLKGVIEGLLTSHALGKDILLVSPPGESKSATTAYFASLLGYRQKLVHVFSEMTLTDLFLRRATNPLTGETAWEASPLLNAIRDGDLCVLDGVEKLRPDVLAALQSLCLSRDMYLPDGRRIMPVDDSLEAMDPNVIQAHPAFRIVALATSNKEAGSWLTQDAMSMFSTIVIPPLGEECTRAILRSANPLCPEETISKLLKLRSLLTADVAADCGVGQLSTRNLIRIAKRASTASIGEAVRQVLVTDLLPPTQRAALNSVLQKAGIKTTSRTPQISRTAPETKAADNHIMLTDKTLRIGDFTMHRESAKRPEMVPSPRFFDIPSHVRTIKNLLLDWSSGERAFLVLGNQGVGKNVIIDRLCEVVNFEREYIQLHRDSTIPQLTLQPSIQNGQIVWTDSPLVRAAEQGLTLVIDEADKAPTEVLAVLKGLAEDGELLLGDGRRISRHETGPGIIEMHKNFTLVVLANRPGFPFQGNQFFKQIGDCFSTYVIGNPDIDSEIELLRHYGPDVDEALIRSLAGSFAELRSFADRGDILYPYSTREAVAVIKHLQAYPSDDISSTLHNVLDFDSYDANTYGMLGDVFKRHGIPVERYASWQDAVHRQAGKLTLEYSDGRPPDGSSSNPPPIDMPKEGKWDAANEAHVGGNQWAGGTGGSNTAGLGGRGGPYRLDRGHQVHQISDEKKAEVSEDARKAARAMAEKALKEKLEEIDMTETEWDMYQRFVEPIKNDIANLRAILNQVELKQSEKTWLKRQSHGEVDDGRLVEGVTGDSFIYKRRGSAEDAGPMVNAKRLTFVVDVSGSMYRFNGYDQRLYRCLESVNLIMASFDGMQQRFDYQIVGHSGDSPSIPFVQFGLPPTTEKQRMRVLQGMIAHSQYCQSGDHTLEAVEQAIADLADVHQGDDESGGGIVIAVSDANLRRYGIHPRYLAKIIEDGNEHKIKAHCVFIGSLGEEADEIKRELPTGRAYICMQTKELPTIIRNILSTYA
ncbi:von Willebrand factor A domain-containing protein 8 [Mayamaea pseudoterrestris]|nr:von Willebrand factor A domain-containing protein 8 [Mayamaea pseudoterrestris]